MRVSRFYLHFILFFAAMGLLAIQTVGCYEPQPTAVPGPAAFGMGIYLVRTLWDDGRMTAILDAASEAGVQWSREEFHWTFLQPERGDFDADILERYDKIVEGYEARDIQVLGLLAYTVPWSSGDNAPATDAERADYAAFVAAMVERYRGRITHWEIWNEPNLAKFWPPEPDPKAYFELLRASYIAAKAVDPEVKIAGCATAGVGEEFVQAVLELGGADYMDILSIHIYADPDPLELNDGMDELRRVRDLLRQYDADMPLWCTETGYPTPPVDGVSYERQAALLVRDYLTLFASGVEFVAAYDFVDDGFDPEDHEQNFGILQHDLTPKNAYTAYATMTKCLKNCRLEGEVEAGPRNRVLRFVKPVGQEIFALWNLDDREATVTFNIEGDIARVYGMYGHGYPYTCEDGLLSVTVTGDPVYVVMRSTQPVVAAE